MPGEERIVAFPMDFLEFIRSKSTSIAGGRGPRFAAVLWLVIGIALVAVGYVMGGLLSITAGSLAGVAWFLAGNAMWASLSEERRSSWDVVGRYSFGQRRTGIAVTLLVWVGIVVFAGPSLSVTRVSSVVDENGETAEVASTTASPLFGALTVAVALLCWVLWRARDDERAAEEATYERWLEAREARRRNRRARSSRFPFRRRNRDVEEYEEEEEEFVVNPRQDADSILDYADDDYAGDVYERRPSAGDDGWDESPSAPAR